MKKTTTLVIFTVLFAWNKNVYAQVTKNNTVVWAENVESIVPLAREIVSINADWNSLSKYDKEKIFSSITHAVLSGKIKAYTVGAALTIKEFNNVLAQWDTSTSPMIALTNDGSDGAIPIGTPIRRDFTSDDITMLKFNEIIEFDTISNSLCKKVSSVTFYTYEISESGERIGNHKEIFYVKFNDLSSLKKEK